MRHTLLAGAVLFGACTSPMAPTPTIDTLSTQSIPLRTVNPELVREAAERASRGYTPNPPPVEPPAACIPTTLPPEGRILRAVLRSIVELVHEHRRDKLPVLFAIHQVNAGGAVVMGELYPDRYAWRWHGGRIGLLVLAWTPMNGMRFPNAAVLLQAMRAAVPFEAEVRLLNRDLFSTCQPRGRIFGRIEGTLHRDRTWFADLTAQADRVVHLGPAAF